MNRALLRGFIVVLALAAITTPLFEGLSYGFAHGNMLLVAVFLGVAAAARWNLPGLNSLVGVFGYQFLYFAVLTLIVLSGRGLLRIRRDRTNAEQQKTHGL